MKREQNISYTGEYIQYITKFDEKLQVREILNNLILYTSKLGVRTKRVDVGLRSEHLLFYTSARLFFPPIFSYFP